MRPDPQRRREISALRAEIPGTGDQGLGKMLVADDVLGTIDVVDEQIQRLHPLLEAGLRATPLGRRDHPRNDVHRPGTIDRIAVTVDGEGDAQRLDFELGGPLPLTQGLRAQLAQQIEQGARSRSRAVRSDQLVEEIRLQIFAPLLRHAGSVERGSGTPFAAGLPFAYKNRAHCCMARDCCGPAAVAPHFGAHAPCRRTRRAAGPMMMHCLPPRCTLALDTSPPRAPWPDATAEWHDAR